MIIIRKKKGGILSVVAVILLVAGGYLHIDDVMGIFDGQSKHVTEIDATAAQGEMAVTFLDVGQGDSTIVQTEGNNMVIDTGDNNRGREVVTYLKEHGIEKLDYLILTHPDADHIGGADYVLREIEVDAVIMPDVEKDNMTYQEVIDEIVENDVQVIRPEVEMTYTLGDAKFTILCPEKEAMESEDANDASVGIKLVHGEKAFVLCGDAGEISEQKMAERFGDYLECDVLKCSHHGSAYATSEAFLEVTDPVWAVISCGRENSYGHPHTELIARLEENDVQIYRTDIQGTITAVSDGRRIQFH